ncbi:MAG: hypothetical protein ABSB19_15710 [Methylomonas sp.]|jgi:uncharacterized membrane protein
MHYGMSLSAYCAPLETTVFNADAAFAAAGYGLAGHEGVPNAANFFKKSARQATIKKSHPFSLICGEK